MEGLTRLVSESLARHGFDRPLDYRRLSWSRWFRCESHHSLLFVPSKPGVFALAEEIMDLGSNVEEPRFSAASSGLSIAALAAATIAPEAESRKPEAGKRMLAVTQFFEDDDMAFVLDRMLSRQNPMSSRLASGRYFVRFVVVEDQTQRRSICTALNQWIISAAEKATGIASDFATSLELTSATEYVPQANAAQPSLFPNKKEDENVARTPSPATALNTDAHVATDAFVRPASEASTSSTKLVPPARTLSMTAPQLDSGAATNIHCPSPFPSGF
ncbi:MAG TPA: hypothetical protein VK812_06725 [Candidatus Binatus sp.]|jgi:hypothetical protein|nr:hypothetical protein [Candidatus Binatus sp.]